MIFKNKFCSLVLGLRPAEASQNLILKDAWRAEASRNLILKDTWGGG